MKKVMILTRRREIFYSLSFYNFILNSSEHIKRTIKNPKLIVKLNSILDCFLRKSDMHMKQISDYLFFLTYRILIHQ